MNSTATPPPVRVGAAWEQRLPGTSSTRADARRNARSTTAMVLLDYVGNEGLRLPREGTSSIALWARLREGNHTTGLATVYRTLALLNDAGVVDTPHSADTTSRPARG